MLVRAFFFANAFFILVFVAMIIVIVFVVIRRPMPVASGRLRAHGRTIWSA